MERRCARRGAGSRHDAFHRSHDPRRRGHCCGRDKLSHPRRCHVPGMVGDQPKRPGVALPESRPRLERQRRRSPCLGPRGRGGDRFRRLRGSGGSGGRRRVAHRCDPDVHLRHEQRHVRLVQHEWSAGCVQGRHLRRGRLAGCPAQRRPDCYHPTTEPQEFHRSRRDPGQLHCVGLRPAQAAIHLALQRLRDGHQCPGRIDFFRNHQQPEREHPDHPERAECGPGHLQRDCQQRRRNLRAQLQRGADRDHLAAGAADHFAPSKPLGVSRPKRDVQRGRLRQSFPHVPVEIQRHEPAGRDLSATSILHQ